MNFIEWFILLCFIGIVVAFFWTFIDAEKKKAIKGDENTDFTVFFIAKIKHENILSSNKIVMPGVFGLAILDNLEGLAYMDLNRHFIVIPKKDILKCDLTANHDQIEVGKVKQPVVTWNTVGNKKATISNVFKSADVKVLLNNIKTPNLKFTFFKLDEAERYHSLINLLLPHDNK